MIRAATGQELGTALLKALDIDDRLVRRVVITADANGAAHIELVESITEDKQGPLAETLSRYRLTPIEEPDDGS